MIEHSIRVRVRYGETDQMGFAHHSVYVLWFEMARIELMRKHGLHYAQMEKAGYLLPVLEFYAKYLKPAYFDDEVTIVAQFGEIKKARFRIHYSVYRDSSKICSGYTEHAFMNKQGRPIRPPEFFLKAVS